MTCQLRPLNTIRSYTDEVTADPVGALDLDDGAAVDAFLHRPLWRTPTWADYSRLAAESEYAAWVIYNRYYLNHFTVSVHNLPAGYNTVAEFNTFLEAHGFRLNARRQDQDQRGRVADPEFHRG